MIKKVLIVLMLSLSVLFANGSLLKETEEYKSFTLEQKEVLRKAYKYGEPYNMGFTLAAIAWVESRAGIYLINLNDPSAGVFHNNIKSVMSRHYEIVDNSFQRNVMAQRLIEDMEFSAAEALAELEYWKSVHGANKWMLIWQSYNGGFWSKRPGTPGYDSSLIYAKSIYRKVHFLMNCESFVKLINYIEVQKE